MTWLTFLPTASVVFAFNESNLAGKIIVFVLFLGSVFAWSIMLTKFRDFGRARAATDRFLGAYRRDDHPVSLFLKRESYAPSPLDAIYMHACEALATSLEARGADRGDLFMGGVGSTMHRLGEMQVSAVRNVAERTMADEALMLEDSMGLLATAVTAAPFLGLLGTVWGVMEAFSGMAATGSPMLSAVAPGISGALLTTVVGLLVALPSSIGYNMLSNKIRRFCVEMDNFSQELNQDVERYFLHEGPSDGA